MFTTSTHPLVLHLSRLSAELRTPLVPAPHYPHYQRNPAFFSAWTFCICRTHLFPNITTICFTKFFPATKNSVANPPVPAVTLLRLLEVVADGNPAFFHRQQKNNHLFSSSTFLTLSSPLCTLTLLPIRPEVVHCRPVHSELLDLA